MTGVTVREHAVPVTARELELIITTLKAAQDYHAPNLQGFTRSDVVDLLIRMEDRRRELDL